MRTATYVYCVVQSARKPSIAGVPGGLTGAASVRLDRVDSNVWLVHAPVPAERYGTAALEQSLRDLEWVSGIALAHEAVVEYFAARRGATVIPMKLFTLFSTPERAVAEMRRRRARLGPVFAKLRGCEEWGVRIMRGGSHSTPKPAVRAATGSAFLAARKRARDESAAARRDSAAAAADAYERLAEIATDHRRRPGEPGGVVPPLLDAAFLVPVRRRAKFQAAAARAAQSVTRGGGRFTLTGPWPAYNFVSAPGEQA